MNQEVCRPAREDGALLQVPVTQREGTEVVLGQLPSCHLHQLDMSLLPALLGHANLSWAHPVPRLVRPTLM